LSFFADSWHFEYNAEAQGQAECHPELGAEAAIGAGMSLFDWLLVGHLVGDFLLQTDGMAKNKTQSWPWMLRHTGIYMAVMVILVVAFALTHAASFWVAGAVLLFIAGTHIILDRREFTLRWMRFIGISAELSWLPIVIDQVFHLLILAVAAQVLVLTSR
jgi:hypothetical protein